MSTIKRVAFLGSGSGMPGDTMYDMMAATAGILAARGVTILTGAYGGSGMEAPAFGADRAGGKAMGFTFLGLEANKFLTLAIDCGMLFSERPMHPDLPEGDDTPNPPLAKMTPEVQYGIRLGKLLEADAFVVGGDGGVGTVVELAALVNLNLKIWPKFGKGRKRVAILRCGGDFSTLREHLCLLRSDAATVEVIAEQFRFAYNPTSAAEWVDPPVGAPDSD